MKRLDYDEKLSRIIKNPYELKQISESAKISNSCIDVIKRGLCTDGITEKQLSNVVNSFIRISDASLSFPTIVACGKRAQVIHAKPTNKKIKGLGYIDFGAKYNGYCTDVTVPFVKGEISETASMILDDTLKIYNTLVNSIRTGSYCWKLHETYSKFLKTRGYEVKHSLGHGLGTDVHEFPIITVPKKESSSIFNKKLWKTIKKIRFEPGMVFTIEPGIYVKGVGGCRIENDFLIGRKSVKQLTDSVLLNIP